MSRFVPRIIRDLRGGAGAALVSELLAQIDAAIEGAIVVRRTVGGEIAAVEASELIRRVEHDGDHHRRVLVRALRTTLVTPIDREDLFRVSRSIDDVLDNLRDFVREWELFEMTRSPVILPVAEAIAAALGDLRLATETVVEDPKQIVSRTGVAKKAGNGIRRAYEVALAALYREPLSIETLKVRDLLRRLDIVGLRFGAAADSLSDAAVKRSEL